MAITRRMFWNQAMQGGTIIGLAMIFLSALRFIIEPAGIINTMFFILNIVVFAFLVWYFTNRLAKKSDPAVGFAFGSGVGFTIAMMLFTGLLMGIYTYLLNNFIAPHIVDELMEMYRSVLSSMAAYGDTDSMMTMMRMMQTNLFVLIFSGIFGYVLYGLIIGLITSSIAQKRPNVFANMDDDE